MNRNPSRPGLYWATVGASVRPQILEVDDWSGYLNVRAYGAVTSCPMDHINNPRFADITPPVVWIARIPDINECVELERESMGNSAQQKGQGK